MDRYEWKKMPTYYSSSNYNYEDSQMGRTFTVIDTVSSEEYEFPIYAEKETNNGKKQKVIVISPDLWNEEFFNWICKTAPDFFASIPVKYVTEEMISSYIENAPKLRSKLHLLKLPMLTSEHCVQLVKRDPSSILLIPNKFVTIELANAVVESRPDLIRYIPKEVLNDELCLDCYNRCNTSDKILLVCKGIMSGVLTKDMFEELVSSIDNIIIFDRQYTAMFFGQIPQSFFTRENVKKLLDKDATIIGFIPTELLTEEDVRKSVLEDPLTLGQVPEHLVTEKLIKHAIDSSNKHYVAGMIDEKFLTEDLIKYIVTKDGLALGSLPKESRTKEVCEIAVSKAPGALRYVPFEFKTYEMCFNCVKINPLMIKSVPSSIISEEFIDSLLKEGVTFPGRLIRYIDTSLEANKKLNSVPKMPEKISFDSKVNIPSSVANKKLSDLPKFFPSNILTKLAGIGIKTYGELLDVYYSGKIGATISPLDDNYVYILNVINLLNCKFFDIDPMIEEDSDLELDDIATRLALSYRSKKALRFADIKNADELFTVIRSDDYITRLRGKRNFGEASLEELVSKVSIVTEYHDKHPKEKEVINEETSKELEGLTAELKRLRDERNRVDNEIDSVIKRIQEKAMLQSKGSVLK